MTGWALFQEHWSRHWEGQHKHRDRTNCGQYSLTTWAHHVEPRAEKPTCHITKYSTLGSLPAITHRTRGCTVKEVENVNKSRREGTLERLSEPVGRASGAAVVGHKVHHCWVLMWNDRSSEGPERMQTETRYLRTPQRRRCWRRYRWVAT